MNSNLGYGIILVSMLVIATIVTVLLITLSKKDDNVVKKVQSVAIGVTANSGVGIVPPTLLYSYDGKTWAPGTGISFSYDLGGVNANFSNAGSAYGNERWVATGQNKDTNQNIIYSDDGIDWKAASRRDGMSIFYNGAVNSGYKRGNAVAYSTTLKRWVAVGKDINNQNILYSSDGITWDVAGMLGGGTSTFIGASALNGGYNVKYANNIWVAVGEAENDDSNILYSTNGISWTKSTMLGGASAFVQTGGGGGRALVFDLTTSTWYAGGQSDNNITLLSSTTGDNWQEVNATITSGGSFLPNGCYSLAYSLKRNAFLATGISSGTSEENLLFTETTLQNWESTTMSNGISFPFPGTINGNEVAYSTNLDLWLAAGGPLGEGLGGALIYSSNGISWNKATMSNGVSFPFGSGLTGAAFSVVTRD